jgi:uncharacterized membrane protein
MSWLRLFALPALLILLCLPLVAGAVPPNRWYGYRTPRSLGSESEWYRLNRLAGLSVIAGALFAAGLKWFLLQSFAGSPQLRYLSLVDAFVLLAVVAILVATQE